VAKKLTSYRQEKESVIFRLYETDIVTVGKDTIILNSGGYRTVTTKRRMNEISEELGLGFSVSSIKGKWMVFNKGYWYIFSDRMVLSK